MDQEDTAVGPNITMIGISPSDRSTIGVLLAKRPGFSFADVDTTTQEKEGWLLKEIITEEDVGGFLKVEGCINAGLDVQFSAIAPRSSIIYGEEAMEHLKEINEVICLKMSYEEVENRIDNVVDRSMALKPDFTLRDLYNERTPYYEKYADITIDEEDKTPGETVDELRLMIESTTDRGMVQRIAEEQKRKLEERDRELQEYGTEIVSLKEQPAQIQA